VSNKDIFNLAFTDLPQTRYRCTLQPTHTLLASEMKKTRLYIHLHKLLKQSGRFVKLQLRLERAQNKNYCSEGCIYCCNNDKWWWGDGDDDDGDGDGDRIKYANYGKYC
jgi:hypothetical protein